ncbi:MAG: hypothetical protein D6698_02380 [Gammaproteobacteria bacterium]|nr:MAG: hypothetical protein D6698_02380 [Gammaproteobacteria bacterium]
MSAHKKTLTTLSIIVLAIIALLTARYAILQTQTPKLADSKAPSNPAVQSGIRLELEAIPDKGGLNLYLNPGSNTYELSTFTAQITFSAPTTTLVTTQSSPEFSPEFDTSSNWKFPFASFEKDGDNLIFNLSALNAAPMPYTLHEKVKIATLPISVLSDNSIVNVSANPTLTQAFTKSNTKIPLKLSNLTVRIN